MNIKMLESWYNPNIELDIRSENYIKLITRTYNMRSNLGLPIPYTPTSYQVQFH